MELVCKMRKECFKIKKKELGFKWHTSLMSTPIEAGLSLKFEACLGLCIRFLDN